jgi:hypothetical protein
VIGAVAGLVLGLAAGPAMVVTALVVGPTGQSRQGAQGRADLYPQQSVSTVGTFEATAVLDAGQVEWCDAIACYDAVTGRVTWSVVGDALGGGIQHND